MPRIVFCLLFLLCCAVGVARISRAESVASSLVQMGPLCDVDTSAHQAVIQGVLDGLSEGKNTVLFAAGDYWLTDPRGLRVPGDTTLLMRGARFHLADNMVADGQAFLLDNVGNIRMEGGEVIGARDAWDDGVNIAGVRITGANSDYHLESMVFRDLSSNAVGVFGDSTEAPVRNVFLQQVTGINCCNIYIDYLQDNQGPAPGSDRRDQGTVAFYYVDGWVVKGCHFEGSRSDGTHFYHAHNGTFVNTTVSNSTMGGYFLEECENVVSSGNYISNNGSRGVTIERNSRFCTFTSNIVIHSGREGMWLPEIAHIMVNDNIFVENGQKNDPERDCEIRIDNSEVYHTQTEDIHIKNNIFRMRPGQTAAIFIGRTVGEVIMDGNTYYGDAPHLHRVE